MQPKLCTRCQFVNEPKSKICRICGNRSFYNPEVATVAPPPADDVTAVNRGRQLMHDLADDVTLTAEKSARAWQQIKRLITGAE
jgi:hypothetical protein